MQTDRDGDRRFGVEGDKGRGRHECRHGCRHVVDGVGGLVDGQLNLDITIGEVHPSGVACRPVGVPTQGSARGPTWMGVAVSAGMGACM